MKIKISLNNILLLLLFVSSFSLAFAYVAEYFFGLKPCILCLYQRIPYFVIAFISAFAFISCRKEVQRKVAIILCILSLFINAGIAFYHVGVEQKIFKMTEKCDDDLGQIDSIEKLREAMTKKSPRCDEPQFYFLGLTMAAWNMVFSFVLGVFTIFLLKRPSYNRLY